VISDYGVTSDLGRAQLVAMQRWYDAETARARRDTDEAARWQTMSQTCGASSLPWLQAYACWRTAETLLAKGHGGRAEGSRWLKTGLQLAEQLGAESIRSELVDLARLAHVDLATAPVPIPVEHPLLTELTAREREIVAMLATGRTYAEIATSLVISEKTVSSHVSNILRKTGTTSRVELTRQLGRS
jgi:DNA-binding CsgD family transcriptional regulator